MTMKKLLALAVVVSAVFAGYSGDSVIRQKTRVDRTKFHIGGYFLMKYATDEAHIRDLRDCGIDFVSCIEANPPQMCEVLDLFDKYGIAAYVGCWPHPDGGAKAGKFHENCPLEKIRQVRKERWEMNYEYYPSFQGGYSGDEPSALDFPHVGKVTALELELMPDVLPYLNLYPNYATAYEDSADSARSQLGCRNYREYIDLYCKHVPLDYISYDFYLYGPPDEHLLPKFYSNYQIVADACRRTGRSFWFIAQANARRPEEWTSENRLRFQAFSAMAFGCESINWGCYCSGWWCNQVLDKEGNKTQQYPKLQRVNGEILRLAPKYMDYRNVATEYVGFGAQTNALSLVTEKKSVEQVGFGPVSDLKATDGQALLVGCMEPRKEGAASRALFICAADDPFDKGQKNRTVTFRCAAKRLRAFGGNGLVALKQAADGSWSFPIKSCAAVLLIVD